MEPEGLFTPAAAARPARNRRTNERRDRPKGRVSEERRGVARHGRAAASGGGVLGVRPMVACEGARACSLSATKVFEMCAGSGAAEAAPSADQRRRPAASAAATSVATEEAGRRTGGVAWTGAAAAGSGIAAR